MAKNLKRVGYVGIALTGVEASANIVKACSEGNTQACTKSKYVESGKAVGAVKKIKEDIYGHSASEFFTKKGNGPMTYIRRLMAISLPRPHEIQEVLFAFVPTMPLGQLLN
ncbi:hypothetical protein [Pseudoalteromonas ostreae]|uniref:hypothetical protein n=1 Tax=Pseudoalteromonas ostreae TaxID=2774154 RepID=UPI001B3917B1|nr:hypothetical protein [Pseudoalteromonas ostreae]